MIKICSVNEEPNTWWGNTKSLNEAMFLSSFDVNADSLWFPTETGARLEMKSQLKTILATIDGSEGIRLDWWCLFGFKKWRIGGYCKYDTTKVDLAHQARKKKLNSNKLFPHVVVGDAIAFEGWVDSTCSLRYCFY